MAGAGGFVFEDVSFEGMDGSVAEVIEANEKKLSETESALSGKLQEAAGLQDVERGRRYAHGRDIFGEHGHRGVEIVVPESLVDVRRAVLNLRWCAVERGQGVALGGGVDVEVRQYHQTLGWQRHRPQLIQDSV